MDDGRIRCVAVDTPVPSQFSHEILNANPYAYLDDAPLEERRARAVEMRRILPESVLEEVGKLDPAAIAQVREEAWPDVRDADELHDVLHTLIALPKTWGQRLAGSAVQLSEARAVLSDAGASFARRGSSSARPDSRGGCSAVRGAPMAATILNGWSSKDARPSQDAGRLTGSRRSAQDFLASFPRIQLRLAGTGTSKRSASRDDALLALVTGWMSHLGPATAPQLGELLGLPSLEIDKALLRMEASGAILRGTVHGSKPRGAGRPRQAAIEARHEWCERRLLARIHRLTVATLRKQIEPVTAAQFMQWLLRWQHVAPGTQVQGERATLEVVRQLQGFEIPANAWERQILARRIADYDPKWLDQLCLTGAVGWGRLSPHPATLEDSASGKRRVIPTSVAPITFFIREEADWMMPHHTLPAQQEPHRKHVA